MSARLRPNMPACSYTAGTLPPVRATFVRVGKPNPSCDTQHFLTRNGLLYVMHCATQVSLSSDFHHAFHSGALLERTSVVQTSVVLTKQRLSRLSLPTPATVQAQSTFSHSVLHPVLHQHCPATTPRIKIDPLLLYVNLHQPT